MPQNTAVAASTAEFANSITKYVSDLLAQQARVPASRAAVNQPDEGKCVCVSIMSSTALD
jgi:hypothetical protein